MEANVRERKKTHCYPCDGLKVIGEQIRWCAWTCVNVLMLLQILCLWSIFVGFPPLLKYRWRYERLGSRSILPVVARHCFGVYIVIVMPTCCCVPGCSTRGGLSFPKDKKLKKLWVLAIKRNSEEFRYKQWCPQPHSVVCHKHFREDDFISVTSHGKFSLWYVVSLAL